METANPNPTWDATAYEETVETLANATEGATFRVWGADWCGDERERPKAGRVETGDGSAAQLLSGEPREEGDVREVE